MNIFGALYIKDNDTTDNMFFVMMDISLLRLLPT